jgi:hypothetical protein
MARSRAMSGARATSGVLAALSTSCLLTVLAAGPSLPLLHANALELPAAVAQATISTANMDLIIT